MIELQPMEKIEANERPKFEQVLKTHGLNIERNKVRVLQVNMGKLCNQVCKHCHADAGPGRKEIMNRNTLDRILDLLEKSSQIRTVDLTGGAPEMNPNFRYFVSSVHSLGIEIIDRCNLTILTESGQEDTARFLRDHNVQIISSLPCYTRENVDAQRGKGVFDKSMQGLQQLNALGYGKKDAELILNLVYNPGGAFLPADQKKLEVDYKARLWETAKVEFNQLYTITNMPINRFNGYLQREGKLDEYKNLLVQNFNACAAVDVMCKELISLDWEGKIYDCDFNQMLGIPVQMEPASIWELDNFSELNKHIVFDEHCFGCTAGAGSSCSGALSLS